MIFSVAVFVKYPQAGRVKTRLGKQIGDAVAADLYSRMIEHLIERTFSKLPALGFDVTFLCDPYRELDVYRQRFPFPVQHQQGRDLGERLHHAFAGAQPLITVGTDCVDLLPAHFEEARDRLCDGTDLVLGPAEDGGYYLIACQRLIPELFDGIPWSTSEVLVKTQAAALALGLRMHLLPTLRDIDTQEDLAGTFLEH